MKYQYDFSFLEKWMALNKDIPKGAVQQAIGSKSNNGLKSWMHGERPMPIISMLRFCNTFQVPLNAFFRDSEADGQMRGAPQCPREGDRLEPISGFDTDADSRTRGERSILDPLDVEVIPSAVPDIEGGETVKQNVGDVQKVEHAEMAIQKATTVVGNISDANMSAIIEMEAKHNTQVSRLLDIIADQQKQIADLTNMLLRKQGDACRYDSNGGYIAAEP
jgi:hypothetical protein